MAPPVQRGTRSPRSVTDAKLDREPSDFEFDAFPPFALTDDLLSLKPRRRRPTQTQTQTQTPPRGSITTTTAATGAEDRHHSSETKKYSDEDSCHRVSTVSCPILASQQRQPQRPRMSKSHSVPTDLGNFSSSSNRTNIKSKRQLLSRGKSAKNLHRHSIISMDAKSARTSTAEFQRQARHEEFQRQVRKEAKAKSKNHPNYSLDMLRDEEETAHKKTPPRYSSPNSSRATAKTKKEHKTTKDTKTKTKDTNKTNKTKDHSSKQKSRTTTVKKHNNDKLEHVCAIAANAAAAAVEAVFLQQQAEQSSLAHDDVDINLVAAIASASAVAAVKATMSAEHNKQGKGTRV